MTLYLDSSALAKRYLEEQDTEAVAALLRANATLLSSIVAYPEMRAALSRALRGGRLDAQTYAFILSTFETDWREMAQLDLPSELAREAGEIAARHHLRGFDAIHLASAIEFRRRSGESVTFLAFDERLMAAAQAEGLAIPSL